MKKNARTFYAYVIPAIFSFALSGVYAIVDGYFVGNSIGDAGLSAINIAYPLVAVLQALGTGLGMGGAVKYSISKASGENIRAAQLFVSVALWMVLGVSAVITLVFSFGASSMFHALGASGKLLELSTEYLFFIALGTVLQIFSTGLIPFIRNFGGSFWAMLAMMAGFGTNIVFDYIFVWVLQDGMRGAALATVIGQGVTAGVSVAYCVKTRALHSDILRFSRLREVTSQTWKALRGVLTIGLAPFGLALVPNISLVIINKFSSLYGGEEAIAVYACMSYIVSVVYLILQGVGDGAQPLLSSAYGAGAVRMLRHTRLRAYIFTLVLSLLGTAFLYATRGFIGPLFGSSASVTQGIIDILPIFLISVPTVAIARIATASLYATEKTTLAYVLTAVEPAFMLVLMLILPRLAGDGGEQMMIWWSTVFARILTAVLALVFQVYALRWDTVGK